MIPAPPNVKRALTDDDVCLSVCLSVAIRATMQLPVSLRTTCAARADQLLATRRVWDTDMASSGR